MSLRIDDLGGAVSGTFDLASDFAGAARDAADTVAGTAEEVFGAALSLGEGFASRRGILPANPFFALTRDVSVSGASGTSQTPPDTAFDGHYVGSNGRTYPPSTPLSQVAPVEPRNGRTSNETLVYVNGISTTKDGQFNSLQAIADRTGQPVVGIHNATQGGFLDVIQSAGDTVDLGRNPAVDALADTVYEELRAGRTVHLMAHSQGALITSRALQDVSNRLRLEDGLSRRQAEALLSRVKVETFGGAAGGYPDGPRYVHYVNRYDAVSTLFGLGPFANPFVNPGRGAIVHRFNESDNAHGFNETYLPRRVPFEQARRGDLD
ncbi:MAG TPA: hypothetical protein VGV38_19245 [Pyrinomonadaceae bacterium]|nr:hypothetical protein [Pyrinomonadaceae bacterium]